MWWQKRRSEIVEDFEREVYGRVPANVPKVTWQVAETVETTVGGQPVVARRVVGHVDNSAHPAISVDITMAVVVPVNAKGPVPVLMMFGFGNMPGDPVFRFPGAQEPAAPPSTEQLIASGWGYVSLSTTSIQADNGAGLTAGIIGLTNKGAAPHARAVGIAARVGLGRGSRIGLSRDPARGRRQARGHRGRFAIRQGGPRHHGLRAPVRDSSWSGRPAKAGPSRTAATSAKRSRTSRDPASTTGWPATS